MRKKRLLTTIDLFALKESKSAPSRAPLPPVSTASQLGPCHSSFVLSVSVWPCLLCKYLRLSWNTVHTPNSWLLVTTDKKKSQPLEYDKIIQYIFQMVFVEFYSDIMVFVVCVWVCICIFFKFCNTYFASGLNYCLLIWVFVSCTLYFTLSCSLSIGVFLHKR